MTEEAIWPLKTRFTTFTERRVGVSGEWTVVTKLSREMIFDRVYASRSGTTTVGDYYDSSVGSKGTFISWSWTRTTVTALYTAGTIEYSLSGEVSYDDQANLSESLFPATEFASGTLKDVKYYNTAYVGTLWQPNLYTDKLIKWCFYSERLSLGGADAAWSDIILSPRSALTTNTLTGYGGTRTEWDGAAWDTTSTVIIGGGMSSTSNALSYWAYRGWPSSFSADDLSQAGMDYPNNRVWQFMLVTGRTCQSLPLGLTCTNASTPVFDRSLARLDYGPTTGTAGTTVCAAWELTPGWYDFTPDDIHVYPGGSVVGTPGDFLGVDNGVMMNNYYNTWAISCC